MTVYTMFGHTAAISSPTWDTTRVAEYQFAKKISLSAGDFIASIGIYVRTPSGGGVSFPAGVVWSDNAGVPDKIQAVGQGRASLFSPASGDGAGRWVYLPVGFLAPSSADYWIGFHSYSGSLQIAYEGTTSPNTYYWSSGGGSSWVTDRGGATTTAEANTSNDYAIRAVVIEVSGASNQDIELPLIDGGTIYGVEAVQTDQEIPLPLLDGGVIYGPDFITVQYVNLPLLDGGQIFGPEELLYDQDFELPLLDDGAPLGPFSVVADFIPLPLIDGGQVFGPAFVGIQNDIELPLIDSGTLFGPDFSQESVVSLPIIANAGAVFGPLLIDPDAPKPYSRVKIYMPNCENTDINPATSQDLDLTWGRTWQDQLNGEGQGTFNMQLDDPAIVALDYGQLIQFRFDDIATFTMVVEGLEWHSVDEGEEADEYVAVSGRNIVAEWESAVLYPELGPDKTPWGDKRYFNFASTDYDDSLWPSASLLFKQGQDPPQLPPFGLFGAPDGWPDADAYWIWSRVVLPGVDNIVGMASEDSGLGYWLFGADGGVFTFGDVQFYGSAVSLISSPVVGGAAMPDGLGYWVVSDDGGVFSFGSAGFYGNAFPAADPIVAMCATPTGLGYILIDNKGNVFAFGDANDNGDLPSSAVVVTDAVGIAHTDGDGYWILRDGGEIYAFGDATYAGNAAVTGPAVAVGITGVGSTGYLVSDNDGAVFAMGTATYAGGTNSITLNEPITGIFAPRDLTGYWLVGGDGGIFSFGSVPYNGSMVNGQSQPVGTSYFRYTFTLDGGATRNVALFFAGDDEYTAWLDGVPLVTQRGGEATTDGWTKTIRVDVTLTEGIPHVIGIKGTNYDRPGNPANIAGVICTAYNLEGDGQEELGDNLFHTGGTGWKALDYPGQAPGFTPGEIVNILLSEAQARGLLTGWSVGGTSSADTEGNPWPITDDVSIDIGMDYFSALRQLSETYIDFRARPVGKVLDLWNIDQAGTTTTTTFSKGVNIKSLVHEGRNIGCCEEVVS